MHIRLAAAVPACAIAVMLMSAAPTMAATITPVSYVFDQHTDTGTYVYNDTGALEIGSPPYSGGTELTDGVLGYAGWAVAGATPWVGWTDPLVNIDFTFSGSHTFNSVSVGTTQDNLGDVVLPNLRVFSSLDGLAWTLEGGLTTAPDSANDHASSSLDPHVFLTVSGLNFTSPYVRLEITNQGPGYGTFSFVDEVKFAGGAVPEPTTWAMMLMGFFGLGAMLRRTRHIRVPALN
jgi:hypothetical protein